MISDHSRYTEVFFAEAQEHLQALNDGLLVLEQDAADHDAINSVFRAAHTIKGMAATMGYNTITALTHNLENMLDQVRAGSLQLSLELSDLLFEGVDLLEGILSEAQAESEPGLEAISFFLEQLEQALATGETAAVAEEKAPELEKAQTTLQEHEIQVVNEARARGFRAYYITVYLTSDCLMKSVRVFLIFQRLQAQGEILRAEPPVEDLEEEKFEDNFRLLYISKLGQAAIEDIISGVVDVVETKVEALEPDKKMALPAAADPKPAAKRTHRHLTTQTVRIDIHRLDNLMNLVGELVITKTQIEQLLLSHDSVEAEEALKSLSRVAGGLQDGVMKARMVPLAQVFNRFPRMVRDLTRELGREVDFTIEGEETELDRTVIDEIGDPLMHLLRNAVDHGIEAPEVRTRKGKPARGKVRLSAGYEGNHVTIVVEDDGEGMDSDTVLLKAQNKGLITAAEASRLTIDETYRLLFMPGFSTSQDVSDVSGRGVGLDVVQNKIDSLGGTVEVSSAKDKGMRFTIRLPLTLAIIQALMIETGAEIFALPLEAVEEIRVIEPAAIKCIRSREVMVLRGEVVPLIRLGQLLGCQENSQPAEELSVVVVRGDGGRAGLTVDSLLGQREIVIKSLDRFLGNLPGIGGATIMGDGKVALILDPAGILNLAAKSNQEIC